MKLLSVLFLSGALILMGVTQSMSAGTAPEIKTLVLGMGIDPPFVIHVVAIEKGWFKEAGFERVETPTFTAGALAGQALAARELHLWTPGNLPAISLRSNGVPIVVVGTDSLAYLEKLVVREDAYVQRPADLYRIRIGLLAGSTASAVLDALATHYHLDVNRLQVVNLQPPEQLASLADNRIQAFICWNPWPYLALQKTKAVILNNGTTSFFPQDKGQHVQVSNTRSIFVTSEGFLRQDPNAARAMMAVLLRAQAYVADPAHRVEVIRMFSEYTHEPVAQNEAIWSDYDFQPKFDRGYWVDMEAYTRYLDKIGTIHTVLDPLLYTDTDFVAQFNPGFVTLKGRWKP